MIIGVPKEIKNNECRVGLTPKSVSALSKNHKVYIEKDAGAAIGFSNQTYIDMLLSANSGSSYYGGSAYNLVSWRYYSNGSSTSTQVQYFNDFINFNIIL